MKKKYYITTNLTMKEYNRDKWWIDDFIEPLRVDAENMREAIDSYIAYISESGVEVSKSAVKKRQKMYLDNKDGEAEQVGFVFTGKTSFRDDEKINGRKVWSEQYIDIWERFEIIGSAF